MKVRPIDFWCPNDTDSDTVWFVARDDEELTGLGEAPAVWRKFLTSTGEWIRSRNPLASTILARFDEHGANLFVAGYEQARADVSRALAGYLVPQGS